jgi:hypothetical protein
MKRLLAMLVVVSALSGCRSEGPTGTDPFFGRTRVPPPGTGSISGGPTDPYYSGAPSSTAPRYAPPTVTSPQVPAARGAQPPSAAGGQNYTPPGGTFKYQGSSWAPMGSSGVSGLEGRAASASPSGSSQSVAAKATPTTAGRERVVQVLPPRTKAAASPQEVCIPSSARAATDTEPRQLQVPKGTVEITDLPPAGRSTAATRSSSASGGSEVRSASAVQQPDDSAAVSAAVGISDETAGSTSAAGVSPQADYGHDPEYRWLRGKLEYSQIDRHWKLRYIPVDGTTDEFGGSVILPDPKVLAGCERGDFIEVQGHLGQKTAKDSYAPSYEAAKVKRLGQARP